jgi:hypothetical protein
MPKATVNPADTERFDLKTAPPDGFITLRRLTYGQKLERQSIAMDMKVEMADKTNKGQGQGIMTMQNKAVTLFEYRNCVVEHNLTDENEQLLNFTDPRTLDMLDPRVGDEIGELIDSMNNFEDGDLGNS